MSKIELAILIVCVIAVSSVMAYTQTPVIVGVGITAGYVWGRIMK